MFIFNFLNDSPKGDGNIINAIKMLVNNTSNFLNDSPKGDGNMAVKNNTVRGFPFSK